MSRISLKVNTSDYDFSKLPSTWEVKTVGDLVSEQILERPLDGNHGESHPKHGDFVSSGIPFIMATDIDRGEIDLQNCKYIPLKLAKTLRKGFALEEDVLLTHKATIGRTAIIGKTVFPFFMLTPQVTYYRVKNRRRLSNRFLMQYFNSPIFQEILSNYANSGSTRDYLGIMAQLDLPIILPDLSEQYAIAATAGNFEEKINLLNRQINTLESLSGTLFRQWFIEEAGDDWKEIMLSDIADHIKNNMNPSRQPDQLFRHYSLPAFDGGKEPISEVGKQILSSKYTVESNSILISKLNPRTPRVWALYGSREDGVGICSTEFQVLKPKIIAHFGFIYYFLKSFQVTNELANASSGTSGSHQRVNPDDILSLNLLFPPEMKIREFDEVTRAYLRKIGENRRQIRTLTKLRDTLVPKLMTGEVRVEM